MKRKEDIQQKLAYALTNSEAFGKEVTKALIAGTKPQFLGDKLATILAACRECFDYAAKDIAEALVEKPPSTVYFPFATESLTRKPWSSTEHANDRLLRAVRRVTKRIVSNDPVPGTRIGHGILAEINTIVNDKKHNVITVATTRENSRTLVTLPNGATVIMSPMMQVSDGQLIKADDLDAPEVFLTDPSVQARAVPDFRLAYNKMEVTAFARDSVSATWRVLAILYRKCFGLDEWFFNPHETIKPAQQKAMEAARRSLSPIVYRPVAVSLFYKGIKTLDVPLGIEGVPQSDDPTARWAGLVLADLFTAHVWPSTGKEESEKKLQKSFISMSSSKVAKCRFELECDLDVATALIPPAGMPLQFDRIVYEMNVFFRSALSPHLRLHHSPSIVDSLVRAVFGHQPTIGAIYKDPIPMPSRRPARWLKPRQ